MLLGIDIGTTKVAALIAGRNGAPAAVFSADHHAALPTPAGRAEQDARALLAAAWRAVRELPAGLRRQVQAVGLTGQMHGAVLLDAAGEAISPLVTWQDQRCVEGGFLDGLAARTGRRLRSGFGCATLAWLAARRETPPRAAAACTIHDLAAMTLCGLRRPLTDPTDAASWGLFDLRRLTWDSAAAKAAGIDASFLPEVRPCGSRAGTLCEGLAGELGLPARVPVAVALGDNQASLVATLREPLVEIAITIGTGAQASCVLPEGLAFPEPSPSDPFEFRPYPGGRILATAAALSGGSAWAWLAETVNAWQRDLGRPELPKDELCAKLNSLGLAAGSGSSSPLGAAGSVSDVGAGAVGGGPIVAPNFLGERHDPALRGAITRLGGGPLALGRLARGLANGIVANLASMMWPPALAGRTRLVGSGNALRRNPLLQEMARKAFGLPLVMTESREEAALGAALNARTL